MKYDPMAKQSHDSVNHPLHYTSGSIECIDAIRSALGDDGFISFCRGNAIKYVWRAGLKEDAAEDLRKAKWYEQRAAEVIEESRTNEPLRPGSVVGQVVLTHSDVDARSDGDASSSDDSRRN